MPGQPDRAVDAIHSVYLLPELSALKESDDSCPPSPKKECLPIKFCTFQAICGFQAELLILGVTIPKVCPYRGISVAALPTLGLEVSLASLSHCCITECHYMTLVRSSPL